MKMQKATSDNPRQMVDLCAMRITNHFLLLLEKPSSLEQYAEASKRLIYDLQVALCSINPDLEDRHEYSSRIDTCQKYSDVLLSNVAIVRNGGEPSLFDCAVAAAALEVQGNAIWATITHSRKTNSVALTATGNVPFCRKNNHNP